MHPGLDRGNAAALVANDFPWMHPAFSNFPLLLDAASAIIIGIIGFLCVGWHRVAPRPHWDIRLYGSQEGVSYMKALLESFNEFIRLL